MAVEPKLSDAEITSLMEIPHPSKAHGDSIYGSTSIPAGLALRCTGARRT